MFKILMIIAVVVLALGWIAYGIWSYRERIKEKNEPEATTEHLEKVKDSFAEYTEKMKHYKKPTYKRE